jgi:hypothetical protein
VRAYLDWDYRQKHYTREVTDTRGFTPGPNDPHRAVYRSFSFIVPEGITVRLTMCYAQGDFNRRCSQPQFAVG